MKRGISDIPDTLEEEEERNKRRAVLSRSDPPPIEGPSSNQTESLIHQLTYPPIVHPFSGKAPPFQQPAKIITFSYNESHELLFDDSARRFYVPPPIGAKLGYGYDQWIRKPDDRGRIDSLLKAYVKAADDNKIALGSGYVGVVAWRGVITK